MSKMFGLAWLGWHQTSVVPYAGTSMTHQVNTHHAKTYLSQLLQDAAAGQGIVIAKAGKPVARLIAYEQKTRRRAPAGPVTNR